MKKRDEAAISAGMQIIVLLIVIAAIGAALYVYVSKPPEEVTPPAAQVYSLSISVDSPAAAGGTSSIVVSAFDSEGNPVSGASISLVALAMDGEYAGDYKLELTLSDRGDGTYTSDLISTWAGVYSLHASVEKTDIDASGEVTFLPGPVAEVVISSTPAEPASPYYKSTVTFYFADAYGNSLPPDEVQPSVSVSAGTIENFRGNPNGSFTFDLVVDNWCTVTINVADNLSGVSGSLNVDFPPIYTEAKQDLDPLTLELVPAGDENGEIRATWKDNMLSLKIGIFSPSELGKYGLTVEYDSSALHPLHVKDGDPTDHFPAPELTILSENSFKLSQSGIAPAGGIDVAIVEFKPLKTGKTVVVIKEPELRIITEEEILVPVEIPVPFLKHITVLKPLKRLIVPVKKWIVEGSGITEDWVRREFEEVEEVYHKAAKECKLDYWIVFIVEINHLSKDRWDNYVGADGKLNPTERRNMHDRDRWLPDRWINIYNVPPCSLVGSSGGSITGVWRRTGGIWTDNSKDLHDRNIAHELMHEFSKSEVKDSPEDNSAAQGGRGPNNIMRYCGGGKEISSKQGEILNEELNERSQTYDADGDGTPEGYIYRPGS